MPTYIPPAWFTNVTISPDVVGFGCKFKIVQDNFVLPFLFIIAMQILLSMCGFHANLMQICEGSGHICNFIFYKI